MVVSSVVLFSPTTVILQIGATFGIKKELQAGIGAPAFPCGDWASLHSAFPTPLPRGPLRNNGKNSRGPQRGPLVFLHPSLAYKSKLLTLGTGTKKALKRCLRAFFRCCGERGIRTPGTVTRTSV